MFARSRWSGKSAHTFVTRSFCDGFPVSLPPTICSPCVREMTYRELKFVIRYDWCRGKTKVAIAVAGGWVRMVKATKPGAGKVYLGTTSYGLDLEVGRGEQRVRGTWKQGALIGFPVSLIRSSSSSRSCTSGLCLRGSSMVTQPTSDWNRFR